MSTRRISWFMALSSAFGSAGPFRWMSLSATDRRVAAENVVTAGWQRKMLARVSSKPFIIFFISGRSMQKNRRLPSRTRSVMA